MKIKATRILSLKYKTPILFFIVFLLILSQMMYPQSDSLIIEHYTLEEGLSSNSYISYITQDSDGFLWFATRKGIDRYDGYNFQSYLNDPEDTTSFVDASANKFYEDKEGVIWIGTTHGIAKYNRLTNSFTNYLPDRSEKGQMSANYIYDMIEDRLGTFWVSTQKGVFKFNKVSAKFTKLQYNTVSTDSMLYAGTSTFSPLFVDNEGSLWYGTPKGLDKFNYETGKLVHYWPDPEKRQKHLDSIYIGSFSEDKEGTLWLGTDNGLVEFDKKSNTFTNYLIDSAATRSSEVNIVLCQCLDPSGLLWVGTARGIFTFDTKLKKFVPKFINKSVHDYYIGNNFILSLYIDHSGDLWAGTLADGIYKVILKKLPYKRYFTKGINSVRKGNNEILWIKKGLEGWVKFNTKTDQITPANSTKVPYYVDQSGNIYYMNQHSTYITKVKNGKKTRYNLLKGQTTIYFESNIGVWYGNHLGGLYFFNFKTLKVREVVKTKSYITAIYKDASDRVWAGTYNGRLICYDEKNNSVSEFISNPKNSSSISGRTIFDIYEDKAGNLWFATEAGFNRFVPATRTFIRFNEKNGLAGNTVYNILEDDHGNLWLGTDKGISKFNPVTNQFKNFDVLRGLSSSNWWNDLAVKMDDGDMFFGRSYGLIRFHPDNIKENNYIPPIVITSIRLFDEPIPFEQDQPEAASAFGGDELQAQINLTYDKNFLSFEFAALSFHNSERNQYAYKMEGIDKDWVYSGARRYASYPNMEPGKYIFRVKGSNNDGIWNEAGTSISIIISPPWWKTTWAYISYGFIFVFTLYGIRRYELNRIKLKDKVKLDAAVLKEREETDKVKSKFFANISHEFRTPLTLIQGPAEKINSQTSENIIKDSGIIKRNSKRLLQLVNQLLDLSKLESGRLKLKVSKGNIVSFVKGIALSFESLSEEKDITLKIFAEKDLIELYFDKEKMIKILSNILSNAFKFTPQDGKITVSIIAPPFAKEGNKEGSVEIKIMDTGIGISKEEIPKLFDRFYQVDSSFTKEYEGTGIGLALTKELVELQHGSISVESERGKWTEFTLRFPLGRNHLTDQEIVADEKAGKPKGLVSEEDYYFQEGSKSKREDEIELNSLKEEKTIVLVVEDNYDMREYIKESLGDDYYVEEAMNGEQGVRKAKNIIPDLIISDMMMPKMDGNELTKVLKSDERTSHIPIIILTAKSGHESKLEGLETGADDYLTKPFDIKELQVRIKNQINIRRKLQEKFSKIKMISSGKKESEFQSISCNQIKLRNIDEKFISKLQKIICERMSDESFSTEELGSEVGMSRSHVFRKIKALTGRSPSSYVRSIRLLKAKGMIESGEGNISEIAYSVGFSSPIYFSKCFKDEFGYPPKNLI